MPPESSGPPRASIDANFDRLLAQKEAQRATLLRDLLGLGNLEGKGFLGRVQGVDTSTAAGEVSFLDVTQWEEGSEGQAHVQSIIDLDRDIRVMKGLQE